MSMMGYGSERGTGMGRLSGDGQMDYQAPA